MTRSISLFMVGAGIASFAGIANAGMIDFEDMSPRTFIHDDSFATGPGAFSVANLPAKDGDSVTDGVVLVAATGDAFGEGLEATLFDIVVTLIEPDQKVEDLTLLANDFVPSSGFTNEVVLNFNGGSFVAGSFEELDGVSFDGATLSVTPAVETSQGSQGNRLSFTGAVFDFQIGGRLVAIDEIEFTNVPTPGAAMLGAFAAVGLSRRRR